MVSQWSHKDGQTDRSINSWQNIQNRFSSGSCHNRCFQDHDSPWWQRHISANYFYQTFSGVHNYTHYSKQRGSECNILHKHKNLQTHRDCTLNRSQRSVATPPVCFCCARSWICALCSASWLHITLVCACVRLTSGGLQRREGGNVVFHCHGDKWRCVHCMLVRRWRVCVCVCVCVCVDCTCK